MGLSLEISIPAATVFLQGLLSFFSPCVLPLLPLYLGYLSGGAGQDAEEVPTRCPRLRTLCNTLFFVLGIGFAFLLLGLAMTSLGRFFSGQQLLIARIGGILVILLGLYQLGVFGQSAFLSRERRLPLRLDRLAMSPLTALLMGFVFSFAWTPCVGPTLSGVLLLAASAPSRGTGLLLTGVYTLGFSLPFLAVGLFTSSLLELFRKHRGVLRYTAKLGGGLLVLMGVLMLTGAMNSVSGWLARISAPAEPESAAVTASAALPEETPAGTEAPAPAETEATAEAAEPEETAAPAETEAAEEPQVPEESEAPEDADAFPAPDFELSDQYGQTRRLSDYRGKVVFLNFWATWCPPCRAEMPDIQKLYEKYGPPEEAEVVILAVASPGHSGETDAAGVAAFLEENGYTYPVVMDESGDLLLEYYITAFPTTFMIDPAGNIYGYVPGAMSEEIMQSIIDQTVEDTAEG